MSLTLNAPRESFGDLSQPPFEGKSFDSEAAKRTEPDLFCEPGLFVVRPDGSLYAASIPSRPFSRPPASALYKSLEWILDNDDPARGEWRADGEAEQAGG